MHFFSSSYVPPPPLPSPRVDVTKSIMGLNMPLFFHTLTTRWFWGALHYGTFKKALSCSCSTLERLGQVKRCIAPQDGFKRAAAFLSMPWGNFGGSGECCGMTTVCFPLISLVRQINMAKQCKAWWNCLWWQLPLSPSPIPVDVLMHIPLDVAVLRSNLWILDLPVCVCV